MKGGKKKKKIFFPTYISIFAWNVPLVSLTFLKKSLGFPILLLSSISLHWYWGRLSYLSLLSFELCILMGILYFSILPFIFFFSQLFKRPPQTTILHFCISFILGMVLIPASCTISQTSVHCSSGILSIRSIPLNLFVISTV